MSVKERKCVRDGLVCNKSIKMWHKENLCTSHPNYTQLASGKKLILIQKGFRFFFDNHNQNQNKPDTATQTCTDPESNM